jgi:hypothetical protein
MVRRPLVGELPASGQGVVHDEVRFVGEDRPQDAGSRLRLDGSVKHRLQVCGGDVNQAVIGVDGATVAAFAAHIAEALEHTRSIRVSPVAAAAMTSSSLP